MDLQDVNIESIGGNSNLSEWASEKTQELMLKSLESLHKTIKADNKKIIAELIKSKNSGNANKLPRPPKDDKPRRNNEAAESEKVADAKKEEAKETNNFIDLLKRKNKGVWLATAAISGLASVAGRYVGMFSKTITEYTSLVSYGLMDSANGNITLGEGMGQLMRISNANLTSLAEAFKENSQTIKIYGATPFVKTVNAVRESLYGFGMTSNDAVKFIGKNLEQQRKLGFLNRLSQNQQISYLHDSNSALFKFSKALGLSYEDLMKEAEEATAGSDFAMFLRTLDGDLAKNVKQSADIITYGLGSGIGSVITEMATLRNGTQGMSAAFATMHERGLGPLANELWDLSRQVRNGTITQENADKQLNRIFQTAKGYNSEELFTMLKSVGHVLGVSANEVFENLHNLAMRSEVLDKQQIAKIQAGNAQVADAMRFKDRWNNMFVQLQAAIASTFDKLLPPEGNSPLIKQLTDMFDWIANKIASPEFTKGLQDFVNSIVTVVTNLASFLPGFSTKVLSWLDSTTNFISDDLRPLIVDIKDIVSKIKSLIPGIPTVNDGIGGIEIEKGGLIDRAINLNKKLSDYARSEEAGSFMKGFASFADRAWPSNSNKDASAVPSKKEWIKDENAPDKLFNQRNTDPDYNKDRNALDNIDELFNSKFERVEERLQDNNKRNIETQLSLVDKAREKIKAEREERAKLTGITPTNYAGDRVQNSFLVRAFNKLFSQENTEPKWKKDRNILDNINESINSKIEQVKEPSQDNDKRNIDVQFNLENNGIELDSNGNLPKSFAETLHPYLRSDNTKQVNDLLSQFTPPPTNLNFSNVSTPSAREKYDSEKEIKKTEEPAKDKESTPVENTINKDSTVSKLQELIDIQATQLAILQTQLRVMKNGLSGDGQFTYS